AALLPEPERPGLPEPPLVLLPDVDFCALALSLDFLLDEPEEPDVPDVPEESVAPVMLLPLPPLEELVEPAEPEPALPDELWAIAMLLPNAET
ncbi:hypothetical protein, partial [Escherichia coli]|uniref:hypothetical protein n=1 Tax=Escherichia coli TaxID=562 RepID=UPI00321A7B3C